MAKEFKITIPAVINKADIETLGEWKGRLLGVPLEIVGVKYPEDSLVFRGFAGVPDGGAKKWVGVYRFEKLVQGMDYESDRSMLKKDLVQRPRVTEKTSVPRKQECSDVI